MFENINHPKPYEIKYWMTSVNLNLESASIALGISKRQLSRFLSGDTRAKKFHALAMQMLWLVEENNKDFNSVRNDKNKKVIKIPIK